MLLYAMVEALGPTGVFTLCNNSQAYIPCRPRLLTYCRVEASSSLVYMYIIGLVIITFISVFCELLLKELMLIFCIGQLNIPLQSFLLEGYLIIQLLFKNHLLLSKLLLNTIQLYTKALPSFHHMFQLILLQLIL